MKIFDTHAHLDREDFEDDRDAVYRRLISGTCPGGLVPDELADYEIEMTGIVIPAVDAASSRKCIELTLEPVAKPPLYAAVGIHPNHTHLATNGDWTSVTELAQHEKVVAVGETGLDRYWDDAPLETQIDFLHRHLELATATQKPVLIHCRDAWDDLLPIIRQCGRNNGTSQRCIGVIHAFSGNTEQMLECVELGWMISFAGSLTYRNAKFTPLWEAAKQVPADRILVETDSPFMVPHPLRSKLQRNEPVLAALTAKRLADLRNEPLEIIAAQTSENAKKFFGV
jgi:TatD DNase family protein